MGKKYLQKHHSAWLNLTDASEYSGLSTSLIYELIKEGCIVSSTVLRPGRRRGRRLVQRASLDAFIEKGIDQSSSDNTRKACEPHTQDVDPQEEGGAV